MGYSVETEDNIEWVWSDGILLSLWKHIFLRSNFACYSIYDGSIPELDVRKTLLNKSGKIPSNFVNLKRLRRVMSKLSLAKQGYCNHLSRFFLSPLLLPSARQRFCPAGVKMCNRALCMCTCFSNSRDTAKQVALQVKRSKVRFSRSLLWFISFQPSRKRIWTNHHLCPREGLSSQQYFSSKKWNGD